MINQCQFVTEFKYLGHVITCSLSDDKNLQREMRNMYIRTNTLLCRFGKCSKKVKVRLFLTVYLCMVLHCEILIQLIVWKNLEVAITDV